MALTLPDRLRTAADRLPNKFSINDELFQLLQEAADAIEVHNTMAGRLNERLREAADIAETNWTPNFAALFREAASAVEERDAASARAYHRGRCSAFMDIYGTPNPGQ